MAMKKIKVKKHKAWIAALLALAMVLGMAGCSNGQPTAKSLMAGVSAIDLEKYYDMEIEMDVTTPADGQSTSVSVRSGIEGCSGILHLYDTEMSLGVSGISIAFSLEAWMEEGADSIYGSMTMFGQDSGWMLIPMDTEFTLVDSFGEITNSMHAFSKGGTELVLEPHAEGEDYVVTWSENALDAEDLSDTFDSFLGIFAADDAAGAADQFQISSASAQAHFDEETHDLKSVCIEAGTDDPDNSSSIRILITYHTMNGEQTLTIPQSVMNTAVDMHGLL